MRRLILFVLCLFFGNSYFSQDYIPFPDSVATWNVYQFEQNFEIGFNERKGNNFHMEGDTIVNDTSYSKLYARNSYYSLNNIQQSYSPNTNPYYLLGLVREDTTKKVWYRNTNFDNWETNPWPENFIALEATNNDWQTSIVDEINSSTEILLYDFGMEIGDSIYLSMHLDIFEPYWSVVEEISYDILGRKTFVFSHPGDTNCEDEEFGNDCRRIWVEGVGDIRSHPFSLYDTNELIGPGIGAGNDLRCFWENGEQIYIDLYSIGDYIDNCENLNVGIAEIEDSSFSIYPNPSNGVFQIIIPDNITSRNINLSIYNSLGQLVRDENTLRNQEIISLDLGGFSDGIYVIQLNDGEGFYSARVVKE